MEYLLRVLGKKFKVTILKGLNPYCYGIPSQRGEEYVLATVSNAVLILIVMEYLLRDQHFAVNQSQSNAS